MELRGLFKIGFDLGFDQSTTQGNTTWISYSQPGPYRTVDGPRMVRGVVVAHPETTAVCGALLIFSQRLNMSTADLRELRRLKNELEHEFKQNPKPDAWTIEVYTKVSH